jgi:hydrogenase expression/formation protein HypC
MCLGVPGRIVEINGLAAMVDFWGVRREVRLELVDQPVAVGDYILNHVGYAIRRIPETDIQGTLDLYEQLLREAGADGGDLMTADVRSEIAATGNTAGRPEGRPLREPSADVARENRRDRPSGRPDNPETGDAR